MIEYLKEIERLDEYNNFIYGDAPYFNVTHIAETDEVRYFADDEIEQDPFTLEIVSIPQDASFVTLNIAIDDNGDEKYGAKCFDYRFKLSTDTDYRPWVRNSRAGFHGFPYVCDANGDVQHFSVGDKLQIVTYYYGIIDINMIKDGVHEQAPEDTNNQVRLSGNYMSLFVGWNYKSNPIPEDYDGEHWYVPARLFASNFSGGRLKSATIDVSGLWLPKRCLAHDMFAQMFIGWNRITTAPDIHISKLGSATFLDMFKQTNLSTGPNITIDVVDRSFGFGNETFVRMFEDCQNLRTSATIDVNYDNVELDPFIFSDMYTRCTNLETLTLPNLLVINDPNAWYHGIAPDCSNLTTITNLSNCYWQICTPEREGGSNTLPANGTLYYKDYGSEMAYNPADMVPSGWSLVQIDPNE